MATTTGATATTTSTTTTNDPFGYVRFVNRRALVVPTGIAFIVAAFGVAGFLMMLPAIQSDDASVLANTLDKVVSSETDSVLNLSFSESHIIASVAFVGMIAIGIVILSYARTNRKDYMYAYPHLDISPTEGEIQEAYAIRRHYVTIGGIICGIAIAAYVLFRVFKLDYIATGVGFTVGAIGIWLIVHGGMTAKHVDIYSYNFVALKRSTLYSLQANQKGPDRETILRAKRVSMHAQSINRVIITATALMSFALYFLPTLHTVYFWTPLAIGGIAAMLITHGAMVKSRREFMEEQETEQKSAE